MKSILTIVSLLFLFNSSIVEAQDIESEVKALKVLSVDLPELTLSDLPKLELPKKPHHVPGSTGERQYWLNKKDPAPFPGVLLNTEAMALILSEYEAVQKRAEVTLEAQRESDLAVMQLKIAKLNVELETYKKKTEVRLNSKDGKIKRLMKLNKNLGKALKDRKKKFFLGTGAAAIGAIVGVFVGVFAL